MEQYQVLTHKEEKDTAIWKDNFATDVLLGLSKSPKSLPSKYIYDNKGSELFEQIMELPEYYPTACEFEILQNKKNEFAAIAGEQPFNLVELGVGDGRKTQVILEHFISKELKFRFVPIDISEGAIKHLQDRFEEELPSLQLNGIVAEYFHGLKWLKKKSHRRSVVLFMGGNIGNFNPGNIQEFLKNVWHSLKKGDYLIIGFDLKKKIGVINNAYNDARGVTRAFNLNVLKRINKELGGNFVIDNFDFYASYNPFSGAVESFLISLDDQEVRIKELEKSFTFEKWEPVHTEYSFKFSIADINRLASNTGFKVCKNLFDSKGYFVDSVWEVVKR